MKIEDITCVVAGVTYQAVAENSCDGCAGNGTKLCRELSFCSNDSHYKGHPPIIWKEVSGDLASLTESNLAVHIHYHEYDFNKEHPTLVIQGDFGSRGYDIDTANGELTRTCICHAREDTECCCGGLTVEE